MKTRFCLPAIILFALSSCGDASTANDADSAAKNGNGDTNVSGNTGTPVPTGNNSATPSTDTVIACFYYDGKEEPTRMYMMRTGDYVIGDLHLDYNNPAAVRKGSFFGNFSGDTLWANYDYLADTEKFQEEIAMILKGDTMIRGSGTLIYRNGRDEFKDRAQIKFDPKKAMIKGDCNRPE